MGCSLEAYRSRIGTFGNSKQGTKIGPFRKEEKCRSNPSYILLLYLICCIFVILLPLDPARLPALTGGATSLSPSPRINQSLEIEQQQVSFKLPFMLSSKIKNKKVHTVEGNQARRGKPITIYYWNKGSSFLKNKQGDISEIINTHKPLVLGLGEAQFKKDQLLEEVQQPGFTLHMDSCQSSLGVTRCAVYTHNSLSVKRRDDLEDEGIATV